MTRPMSSRGLTAGSIQIRMGPAVKPRGDIISFLLFLFFIFPTCYAAEANPPTAIILYASDTPNEFIYFSTFFTEKLNKEKIFHTLHDHEINKIWLNNAQSHQQIQNVELQINGMKETLKSTYKNKLYTKLVSLNLEFEKKFTNLLTIYPMEIKPHLLAEFFFWSAVAEITNKQKLKNSYLFFEKYATLSEKNLFATEIDSKTLANMQSTTMNKQKTIPIYSKTKCLIYVNGYKLNSMSVTLPVNLKSVLSASCPEGNFSQIFIPAKTQSILINKFSNPLQINSIPSIENLPKSQIQSENVDNVILVFWSKKLNLLETKLIDGKKFTVIKEASYRVQSSRDFDSAGDKLILFFMPKT